MLTRTPVQVTAEGIFLHMCVSYAGVVKPGDVACRADAHMSMCSASCKIIHRYE